MRGPSIWVHTISSGKLLIDTGVMAWVYRANTGVGFTKRRRECEKRRAKRSNGRASSQQVSLGSLGIIAIVLAVGLPAILLGCGESTPQSSVETTPVPESILYDAAHAVPQR